MRHSWAAMELYRALLEPAWAVLEACWTILAALVAFLGRLGSFGESQDGVMAAQGPPGVGVVHAAGREPEAGGVS